MTSTTTLHNVRHGTSSIPKLALTIVALALGMSHTRAATNPVSLAVSMSGPPGRQSLELSWSSQPGALYKLQRRATLGPETLWQDFDIFQPTGATFRVTLDGESLKEESHFQQAGGFYRLVLPEPGIFSIEPARFALGSPLELYVVGQCLDTNTELRVGPLTLTNREIIHHGLMRVRDFVPQAPGTYVFDLVVQGGVVSSFAVECFDPAAPPSSVLQEPPDEPWAAPYRRSVSGLQSETEVVPYREGGVNSASHKIREKGNRTKTTSPRPLKAKEKANRTKHVGLQVTPAGELALDDVDMFIPGVGLDFIWGRRYLSRSGPNTGQGNRWDFSYNVSVAQVADGIEVRDGMGRVNLLRSDNGFGPVYGADGLFYIGQFSNSLFRLTFPDSGYWEFEHPGGAVGKLIRIVDRNNNTMRLQYDGSGRLVRVIDTLNRTNTIAYSPVGKISSVSDFTGRRVTYAYYRAGEAGGNDGDLKSVTSPPVTGTPNGNDFPAGKTTTYTYSRGFADPRENSLLLTEIDAKGQIKHQHIYQHNQSNLEFLRVRASRLGYSNQIVTYNYLPQTPSPANQFGTMKIIVNDRMGNVSEHLYDARLRELQVREFTGRAIPGLHVSETTNRPTGKLRADDPDYFETRFEWNNDSLCTRVVHPRGNATEMTYQRAFNQNSSRSNHARRHNGNLRVLRERACCGGADTDDDGLPDTVELVTRLEHDSRFGSPSRTTVDLKGNVWVSNRSVPIREFSSIDNAPEEKERGFITSVTDPRGSVSTATYDSRGNCIRSVGPFLIGDEPPEVAFAYNAFGQLTSVTNPTDGQGLRRVDAFEYYGSGPQSGYLRTATLDAQGPVALTTTWEYDARGNVIRCVDPRGLDMLWTYNALDQCVLRQTPNTSFGSLVRYATTFFYDANDNVVQVDHENRDHTGALDSANPIWSSFAEYDLLDRQTLLAHELTHVVQQRSATNRFHYDANDNLVRVESPEAVNGNEPDNVVARLYDERDLLFEEVSAPGTGLSASNRFDYDANANCRRVNKVDAFSIKTKVIEHDGLDRVRRVTDPMGNVETFSFDRGGNLVFHRLDAEMTDVPGSAGNRRFGETRIQLARRNLVTSIHRAFFDIATGLPIGDGQSTTTFTYAPNDQLLSETDDNGHTTRYAYDTANRLLRVTDPKTNVVTYGYDGNDNVTSVTQIDRSDLGGPEQRFTMTYEYDGLDRRVRATDNVGNNENWSFDSRDNLVRHIDPRGALTGFTYDGLNRQTFAIADLDGDGLLDYAADIGSASTYDDNSRVTSTTDDNGNVTRYAYDAVDRPVWKTNADNTVIRLVWSPRSNLILYGDPNGTRVTYTYDLNDRCTRKDIQVGPGVAATTTLETFAYDGQSRLVRAATSPGGIEHTFVWNSLSDLGEQSSGGLTLRATHDGVGNRTSLRYPSGLTVGFTYDPLDQVSAMRRCEGCGNPWLGDLIASYSYDGPGRVSREARANGVNTRINWGGYPGAMQLQGDFGWKQVVRVNHQVAQGGAFLDTRVFAYDRAQNKTVRAQTAPFSTGGPTSTNQFSYDAAGRMIQSLFNSARRTYFFDGNGNRQQVVADGAVQLYQMDNTTPEPADFQMNQYSLTPFGGRSYDFNGNQVSIDGPAGAIMFTYDYADRLVAVDRSVGPAFQQVARYAYDALGRRASKTVFPSAPMAPVTTTYTYDGANIIETRPGGGAISAFLHDEDGDVGVWVRNGVTRYFHRDDIGNVLALTDANGSVVERYEYEDYGLPHFLDDKGAPLGDGAGNPVTESPAGNPFLFHGMEWDPETGLYTRKGANESAAIGALRMGHDYVDPQLGRQLGRTKYEDFKISSDSGNNRNWDFGGCSFAGNNPWTRAHRIGQSKWKNIVLKQGFADGGGGGGGSGGSPGVMFNPKDYTISKVTVQGWDPKVKAGLSGHATGGRTHGKWKTFRGGGLILHENAGRSMVQDFEKNTEAVSGGFGLMSVSEPLVHTYRWRAGMALTFRRRVEVLKSTKQGDPNANRMSFPNDEAEFFFFFPARGHRDVGGYRAPGAISDGIVTPNPRGRDRNMTDIIIRKI